jgi:aminopeptidase YwaD
VKKLTTLLLLSLATYNVQAQSFVQAYQNRVNQLTQANITSLLQDFAALGVKTSGSVANNNTLNWLKGKYQTYGYTAGQITEDSFTVNGNTTKNLVVTKTGTVYPNIYVIICGHYDTIVGPGVSDNGSGTSILLEAARILKDIPTEYSIKFIHFSGEEQGLVGSNHYVNNVVFQNNVRQLNLRLVFNIDQVGGKLGSNNTNITCESDQTFTSNPQDLTAAQNANNAPSLAFTQQLANCTTLYSPLQTTMAHAYNSDYMPFEGKGDIITGFYETNVSGNQHTANDTFANVNPTYVFNVGKAAVGALQHFAVATTNLSVNEASASSLESVKVYPTPAKNILNIELPNEIKKFNIEITDMSGKLVLKSENQKEINVSALENGVYLCSIKTDTESVTRKIVIKK